MNKRLIPILAVVCFLSQSLFSQRLPNSILWRISGKDGHHTSYLYGSMHLTDSRIFHLGDSLYAAIHNSDGLATELDPSVLLSLTVEAFENEEKKGKDLKEVLSARDYKVYGPLLARKLKKPVGSITVKDILALKSKWLKDSYAHGGMSTFLDMYLYEVARRQKKWTGGVEDAEDQRGLLNAEATVDKSDIVDLVSKDENPGVSNELEKMIAVYLKQNLTAIDSLFGNTMDKETVLTKRNYKMAGRMDSLSGVRSMVFVVGVAHLPGEEGLIHLLRGKGFDVQPVFSSKKIKPADYPLPDLTETWETLDDENGLYRVSMPGKAQDIDLYHLLKMKMYFDFLDMDGYCVAAFPSAFRADRMDSLLDVIANRVFEGAEKKTYERIDLNGARGRLYTSSSDLNYKKGYFLLKDGIFYMAYGSAVRGNVKNKKNIDRFLKSFEVLDRKRTDSDLARMVVHTDTILAFTVSTPGVAKLSANTINANGHSRLFISTDLVDGGYYFIGVNEVGPDRYILNDSAYFRDLFKGMSGKVKNIEYDSSWVVDDQLIREVRGPVMGVDMEMRTRYIDRGNRWYALVSMTPTSGNTAKVNRFFSSFAELDYPAHRWANSVSPDSLFTAWTPAPIEIRARDSSDGSDIDRKYNSYDTSRAESFGVVAYHLHPYYWSTSDSAFWADRVREHIKYSDTLISKRAVSNGEARGWEWVKRNKRSHNYERLRQLLDGDKLYSLLACGPYKELYTANANRYFESFRFSRKVQPNPYLHSKAQQLIGDLLSADSALSARAYAYVEKAPFQKSDLPSLYRALLEVSPLTGIARWPYRVNRAILIAIQQLKDTGSFRFALDHYRDVPDSLSFIKNNLLYLMAGCEDSLHFRSMAQLLQEKCPPREGIDELLLVRLQDSLRLTATILPELLPLLKDSAMASSLASLMVRLVDSGWLSRDQLLPYQENIKDYATTIVHGLSMDKPTIGYREKAMIRFYGRFNDNAGNSLLKQLLHCREESVALLALETLLMNKQPVDSAALRPMAANRAYRLELYQYLEKGGRPDLFPGAYRSQKALGESAVYNYATDEDDAGKDEISISYLTTRSYGNKSFLFYKYGNGEATYLAGAGPFDPDPARVGTSGVYVHVYYHNQFDSAKLQEQIDALLKIFDNDRRAH